jgi:hypothetical protein
VLIEFEAAQAEGLRDAVEAALGGGALKRAKRIRR